MSKLDPTLQVLLRRHGEAAAAAATRDDVGFRAPPERADMAVKFTGDVADLVAVGFAPRTQKRHPTDGFTIATGSIPVARLGELARVPHLVQTEASRPMRPELNRSVPEIKADKVHEAPLSMKGAGVVIGIIDNGIDIHHENFRRADGSTRLLALWDQTLSPTDPDALPGEAAPANPFTGGVVYLPPRINDALTVNRRLVRTNNRDAAGDVDGHGTHVAGIAAGDGSQSGRSGLADCSGDFTFVGVAPEADLIVVRLVAASPALGASTNLVDAFEWIWTHPSTAGRPIVVNLSMGDNMGAHDGTSLVEGAIDIHVITNHGHVAVKSAGNEGDANRHAEATIAPGATLDVGFTVREDDGRNRHIDLWYDEDNTLDVQLVAPVAGPPCPVFGPGGATPHPAWLVTPRTRVEVTSDSDPPNNPDCQIHVLIDPAARAKIPAGPWMLRLTNKFGPAAHFDAWLERSEPGEGPFFTSHVTKDTTITIPGTHDSIISVGAYSQSGFLFFNWSGDVADSSSRGPTRDGRTKPDLSAPGVGITSAAAEEKDNCCCDCCEHFYVEMDGTSQAAPHVTGVVALMLQKNPRLPASVAKEILMRTARAHGGGSPANPNNVIGAGKLDAKAAVDATPPPTPLAGGGVGGGGASGGRVGAGDGPGAGPGGGGGDSGGDRSPPALRLVDSLVWREWLDSPPGQVAAALASRHFSEVRRLVNHNKRVGAYWHLLQGPALLQGASTLMATGDDSILAGIDLVDVERRAPQFLAVLEKYGSDRLRHDLRRYRPELSSLTQETVVSLLRRLVDRAA